MRDSIHHTVLLAEDNPLDALLVQRVICKTHLPISLQRVENGEKAIEYLQGKGVYADRERYPFPSLLLTNIRMPRLSGFELLAWIKQQPHLKNDLLVVVMSAFGEPRTVERAESLGAVAHYVKPSGLYELEAFLRNILSFLSLPTSYP